MKVVYKYPLLFPINGIAMPVGAELLKVDMQHGELMLWALVDPDAPKETRIVGVAGTGHPIEQPIVRHINTFFMHDGDFVFHAFEVQPS